MSEVIAAIVGVLLGLLLAQMGRAALAWREVTAQDDEADELNDRLLIWVDDHTRAVVEVMQQINNTNAANGLLNSGINGGQLADVKAQALHQYRDRRHKLSDDLQRLRTSEGLWHILWRWVRRRPAPAITSDAKAKPFLDRWREPVTRHQTGQATPRDRTTRTYDDAMAELPDLNLT
jgi:hypothetical protein